MNKKIILPVFLIGLLSSLNGYANDRCEPVSSYSVSHVNFTGDTFSVAVQKLVRDMPFKISVSSGSTGMVTAHDVSGPLNQVLDSLSDKAGMSYQANDCLIEFKKAIIPLSAPAESGSQAGRASPINQQAAPLAPKIYAISIAARQSIKLVVTQFAKENGFAVNWNGDDMFAKTQAIFAGDTFESALNKLFVAARITAVIASDEGNVVNVYVK